MENQIEATVRFVQDLATKGWVWKLADATGSIVAKSKEQYATEDLAKEAFAEFQGEAAEANTEVEIGLHAEVPATPAPVEPTAPEAPTEPAPEAPVSPEATPETTPEAPVETAPVEPTPESAPEAETPSETAPADAGTAETAPVEDAGTVAPTE